MRVDGPYNEHLVRDIGGLNLAMAALLIAAAITLSRSLVITASVATLLYGVPHLVYHLVRRDGLGAGDVAISLGGLALFAAVPVLLILGARRARSPST